MPTYQYACKSCDHRFEQAQAFSDPSLTECPVCDGALRKIYGSVGVVFRGSGFYRTDSRSGSADLAAKTEKPSVDSKSETKTEVKKAEAKPVAAPATTPAPARAAS